jgi:prepilin-type N-terminal cleavage/methylation domain-containing protein
MAGQAGYSLVELLVVVLLMGVILGAIYGAWQGLSRTYAFAEDDLTAQTQARAAMAEMVEYIRTARQPLSVEEESLDAVITEAGPFSLTMWTDTVRDGSHSLQLIRFRVSPDPLGSPPSGTSFELWREQGDPTTGSFDDPPVRLVTADVSNDSATYPLFQYRDALGAPTTDPTEIREVEINLRIDVDPNRSPAVNVLTSIVQPRNLRQ